MADLFTSNSKAPSVKDAAKVISQADTKTPEPVSAFMKFLIDAISGIIKNLAQLFDQEVVVANIGEKSKDKDGNLTSQIVNNFKRQFEVLQTSLKPGQNLGETVIQGNLLQFLTSASDFLSHEPENTDDKNVLDDMKKRTWNDLLKSVSQVNKSIRESKIELSGVDNNSLVDSMNKLLDSLEYAVTSIPLDELDLRSVRATRVALNEPPK